MPAPAALRRGMELLGALSPELAARAAYALFFRPQRPPIKPEQTAILESGSPFHLVVRDEDVQGFSFGEGSLVFLVHGWGGHSGHMAALIGPLVRAGYRVVVADVPGHGRSSGRESSLFHFTDTLDAMAEQFGAPHAVVAHSFGAAGVTVALSRSFSAKRVAFIAPPSTYGTFWSRFRAGVGVSQVAFQRMVRLAEERYATRFARLHPEVLAVGRHEPLLIIHDDYDREIPVGDGMALALAWPGAELVRTRGLGHLRILSEPSIVGRVVDFVAAARCDSGKTWQPSASPSSEPVARALP